MKQTINVQIYYFELFISILMILTDCSTLQRAYLQTKIRSLQVHKQIRIIKEWKFKMFLDDKDQKKKFLEKKNKEKKKIQQNHQQTTNVTKVQKSVRSYLSRKKLQQQLIANGQILGILLIKNDIQSIPINALTQVKNQLLGALLTHTSTQQQQQATSFYLKKLFFAAIQHRESAYLSFQILQVITKNQCQQFIDQVIRCDKFTTLLNNLLNQGTGTRLLNLTAIYLFEHGMLYKLNKTALFDLVLREFSGTSIEEEHPSRQPLQINTLVLLLNFFYQQKFAPEINFKDFSSLANIIKTLLVPFNSLFNLQPALNLLISYLLSSIKSQQSLLVKQISQIYKNLLVLMQDEQDLTYFENKILSHQKMQQFSSSVLRVMQDIFESQKIVNMFFDTQRQESRLIKEVMIESIRMLSQMFQDRKILFLRSLLSSNELLTELYKEKKYEFYEGMKMRLMAMDDEQFKEFNLFSQDQWKVIIHNAMSESVNKLNKLIKMQKSFNNSKKLVPFASKNEESVALNTLSQTLQLLYKKCLRTKKLPAQIFISAQLTKAFYEFNFGTGAEVMERLLKLYPFAFTFESRIQKFKQLIKEDKLKHDRTLFLQQEIDDDLIIHVRRGKEFLDAYHSLFHKDLRKKYKLVFFNEQGLEEEGIDGGGLIKEFINRVLKSAFSEVYGLFYENSQNELLPNPESTSIEEYEFIGKIIGKAVYESITIEQKFVEPFMNLVIGRKNSFEDIQYIDPAIYQSLIGIKKMSEQQLQDMQQTFVIQDQLPTGRIKYVNLLCPSKQVKGTEDEFALVTRQNRLQFVMSYSDYKCNKQLQEKTRSFRKGFLKVLKPEWLTLFNNQELNLIISGGQPDFDVNQLKQNCVYVDYHEKSLSIVHFWQVLKEFTAQQKSQFLLYVTSCSRPPTLGFSSMKPKICISRDENIVHLPTANTCMNVLRLPDYRDREVMRKKLLYAINSKAGFEFA